MAHVPAATATARTNPVSRREANTGNIGKPAVEPGGQIRDKRETGKVGTRTFHEVLQNAGDKAGVDKAKSTSDKIKLPLALVSTTEKPATRKSATSKHAMLKTAKGKKENSGSKSGIVAKSHSRQTPQVVGNTGIGNDEERTDETGSQDNDAVVQNLNSNHNASVPAASPRPPETSHTGTSKTNRKKKISANYGSENTNKTQMGNRPNLSSKSSKVEVIDNRFPPASPRNHDAEKSDGEGFAGDVRDIDFTDVQNGKATHKVENSSHGSSAEPVRLEQGQNQNFNTAVSEIKLSSPGGDGSTMQKSAAAELAQKLNAQSGNEIVRQVKVVLNNANSGEVQINLRPDNLGQVKIRIHLEDNRLTGRIFVESAAAREAFRNALDGLQTRLVESGFGSADLEMSWDESPGEFTQNKGGSGKQNGNRDEAIREFDSNIPTINNNESAESRINMVV